VQLRTIDRSQALERAHDHARGNLTGNKLDHARGNLTGSKLDHMLCLRRGGTADRAAVRGAGPQVKLRQGPRSSETLSSGDSSVLDEVPASEAAPLDGAPVAAVSIDVVRAGASAAGLGVAVQFGERELAAFKSPAEAFRSRAVCRVCSTLARKPWIWRCRCSRAFDERRLRRARKACQSSCRCSVASRRLK